MNSALSTSRPQTRFESYLNSVVHVDMQSSPINLLIQIPQDPRRHAPDIALAERHLVIMARDALPVAAFARVVRLVHHEGERHLEGVGDLARVDAQLII